MKKTVTALIIVFVTVFITVFIAFFIAGHVCFAANPYIEQIRELEQKLPGLQGDERLLTLIRLADMYRIMDNRKVVKYARMAYKQAKAQHVIDEQGWSAYLLSEGLRGIHRIDEALKYAKIALEQWTKIRRKDAIAYANSAIGLAYMLKDDFENSLIYLERARRTNVAMKNHRETARILLNIGNLYLRWGKHEKCMPLYMQALKHAELAKDQYCMGAILGQLAAINKEIKQYGKALEYYKQALKIRDKLNDTVGAAHSLSGISTIYVAQRRFNKALEYELQALNVRLMYGHKQDLASSFNRLGFIYFHLNRDAKAIKFYKQALKSADAVGNKFEVIQTIEGIAIYYNTRKNYTKALEYLNRGLTIVEQLDSNFLKLLVYRQLADTYQGLGNYKKALHYYRRFDNTDEKVVDDKSRKLINQLQAKYEAEKREKEIIVLKKEKEIKLKENELLKKDKKIQGLQLDQTKLIRNAFIGGFILVSIILGLLFKKYLYLFAFWKKQKYIGKFRLMEKLGSGAMGTVYKAHGIVNKKELAAVKILKEEYFSDETTRRRFKREAAIIDKLEHPNIVKIFERGQAGQTLYIAMEFFGGDTLNRLIEREHPLTVPRGVGIMVQATRALLFIHRQNIIHRDLKPANIMIIREDGREIVKLLDFGLAKVEVHARLTQSGNFIGTLEYMSPEQILNADSTPANDIFSLGVTFYRLLINRSPFPGNTPVDIMRQIIKNNPPAPITLRPDIPPDLDRLIMAMINKKPEHRPNAETVLAVLTRQPVIY